MSEVRPARAIARTPVVTWLWKSKPMSEVRKKVIQKPKVCDICDEVFTPRSARNSRCKSCGDLVRKIYRESGAQFNQAVIDAARLFKQKEKAAKTK